MSCDNPQWVTAFQLAPAAGCPGNWLPTSIPGGAPGGANMTVCGRGKVLDTMQSSAILLEGWLYSKVRGTLTARMMGSPDSFRPESGRGPTTIDDAYVDGVSFTRWSRSNRVHMATYAVGLSYSARCAPAMRPSADEHPPR